MRIFKRIECLDKNKEIVKDPTKSLYLRFVYSEDSKEIEEEPIKIDERKEDGFRTIQYDEYKRTKKYRIIETQEQLEKLEQSNNHNYSYNIFLIEANFVNAKFSEEAKFMNAKFCEKANFWDAEFSGEANFWDAEFSGEANFWDAEFSGKADFSKCVIKKYLDFSSVRLGKNHEFNFKNALIERMDFTSKGENNKNFKDQLENVANRESFLILKELANKQSDQISALHFYTLEMEQYKKDLKSEGKKWYVINRLILNFESSISSFGTNIYKPIGFLVFINLAIFLAIFYFYNIQWDNFLKSCAYGFNPIITLDKIDEELFKYIPSWVYGIYYFLNILKAILIYEIIKSFRKYSRKM